MEYLCIDYGTKRVGLACADDNLSLALPMDALISGTEDEKIAKIIDIISARRINMIVVGYPLSMDDTVNETCAQVDKFIEKLSTKTQIPVVKHDERLTSFDAENSDCKIKKSKKQTKKSRAVGSTDSRAAAIILQDFIDEQNLKFDR